MQVSIQTAIRNLYHSEFAKGETIMGNSHLQWVGKESGRGRIVADEEVSPGPCPAGIAVSKTISPPIEAGKNGPTVHNPVR